MSLDSANRADHQCGICRHFGAETFTGDCSCSCHDWPKKPSPGQIIATQAKRIAQLEKKLAIAEELARLGGWKA